MIKFFLDTITDAMIHLKKAFRSVPFRSVPFRSVPFRSVPFRSVPFRKKFYPALKIILLISGRHTGLLVAVIGSVIGSMMTACGGGGGDGNDPDFDLGKGAAVGMPTLDSKTHNNITINAAGFTGGNPGSQTVGYARNGSDSAPGAGWSDFLQLNSQYNVLHFCTFKNKHYPRRKYSQHRAFGYHRRRSK